MCTKNYVRTFFSLRKRWSALWHESLRRRMIELPVLNLLFNIVVLILLVVILQLFISLVSRNHFPHMFSLCFHDILGAIFNDVTVIKQMNSWKSHLQMVNVVCVRAMIHLATNLLRFDRRQSCSCGIALLLELMGDVIFSIPRDSHCENGSKCCLTSRRLQQTVVSCKQSNCKQIAEIARLRF